MSSFTIGTRRIGRDAPPLVIAEMSGNHNQSLERALAIVEAAAKAGAHALKLQTYTADTMTLDLAHGEFYIEDPASPWAGTSLHALYQQAHTPWEWHRPLFERARELGMLAFSTPFDETSVDFLESLDVPLYKIASFENTDLPLIRRVAATGKPLIISTGMASVAELDETVRTARAAGCKNLVLLKCTSTYPASPEHSHVRTIPHLREMFGCEVGLSDHTLGVGAAIAAVALGASVVEKHFTLDRSAGGVDASFSLEPAEMASLVVETERAWQSLGQVHYGVSAIERASLVYRRSLYVVRDMQAGEAFDASNVRAIRPGLGLAPRHLDAVLGRCARQALGKGTALNWSMIL
ncbi:pseudaminic acid synthase [Pseudomonas akapageensis]|uniref:pseudaminic acid synthase n=1 Tax=Pseudomonas akapageensis TaxID=2609961 RepID=UPI00140D545D|nr:pseudaminic acid synthase [Pseudomonas akapageensis]